MVAGALVVAEVGRRSANGTLPRNHLAGIRVPATMRDDESWHTAHVAGGPVLVRAGLGGAAVALVGGVVGTTVDEGAAAAIILAAAALLLVGVFVAARRGVAAIR